MSYEQPTPKERLSWGAAVERNRKEAYAKGYSDAEDRMEKECKLEERKWQRLEKEAYAKGQLVEREAWIKSCHILEDAAYKKGQADYAEKYPKTDREKNLQIMSYDEGYKDGANDRVNACAESFKQGWDKGQAEMIARPSDMLRELCGNTSLIEVLSEVWAESDVENFTNVMEHTADIFDQDVKRYFNNKASENRGLTDGVGRENATTFPASSAFKAGDIQRSQPPRSKETKTSESAGNEACVTCQTVSMQADTTKPAPEKTNKASSRSSERLSVASANASATSESAGIGASGNLTDDKQELQRQNANDTANSLSNPAPEIQENCGSPVSSLATLVKKPLELRRLPGTCCPDCPDCDCSADKCQNSGHKPEKLTAGQYEGIPDHKNPFKLKEAKELLRKAGNPKLDGGICSHELNKSEKSCQHYFHKSVCRKCGKEETSPYEGEEC